MTSPQHTGGWSARWAIAGRDLVEFVRDRRAVFITLVMPMAMYPLLALSSTLGIRTALTDLDGRQAAVRLDLALSGADAGAFAARVAMVADRAEGQPAGWPGNLTIREVDAEDAQNAIDEGMADAWVAVDRGTVAGLDGDGTVALDVRLSTVRPPSRHVRDLVVAVLRGVADEARLARLSRAGLPASLVEPIRIDFTGDAAETGGAAVRDILPTAVAAVLVLLALLTATGAFYPAIDAIAGEKERGTIETLLIAPCTPFDMVAGKFLAVFAVTLATLVANALSIALTATVLVRFLPVHGGGGVRVGAALACIAVTLLAYLGVAAVAAALCLAVTAAAKSAKEAQNTLTPVVMLIAALAGAALLPAAETHRWLPAVPFAGQVSVAKSMLTMLDDPAANDRRTATADAPEPPSIAFGLAVSLVSSAVLTWILLQITAALVSDEEILFRGPDAAAGLLRRPAPRRMPSAWQGFAAALAGFAALWYAQGFTPPDFVSSIIIQQACAVLLPLIVVAWWQRVDGQETYAVRWPGSSFVKGGAVAMAAALIGAGLFLAGAAAALAVWKGNVSVEARELAARLVDFVRHGTAWRSVLLLAVMPAVCEELLFRGWVLSALAGERPTRRRAIAAVLVQAAAFAAFHLLPERMPQTFVMGLALGWMTLATRSLLPAVIAHAAHNATPVMLVATATEGDLAALSTDVGGGLPHWAVVAAIGCLIGGGFLMAFALHGRNWRDSWT
jgi:sodium transport system permease protein